METKKLTLKKIRKILKKLGYKAMVNKGEYLVFVKIQLKDTEIKFEMIKEFIPFLYDFSIFEDRVILYLNKEVKE